MIILNDNLQKLEAALNNEITDDEGQPMEEETSTEEPATQEENQMGEPTQEVNPTEEEVKEPKPETEPEETQLVEDEEGKKYIPEKRFKEIYAKAKENERRAKELEKVIAQQTLQKQNQEPLPRNKADDLEVELLFAKYPQFDPTHETYDEDVDDLAADLYLAGKARTKLEAAKMALEKVKKLSSKSVPIKEEARVIKKAMAESIASRGGGRTEVEPDPDNMSTEELESYMKAKGIWLQ